MVADYLSIIIVLSLPVIVIVGFILSIRFISNRFLRRTVCSVLTIIFLLLAIVCFDLTPYFYACHLERSWSKAQPATRAELEKYLHLYSIRQISPSESGWGKNYKLGEGERMVQYLILWNAPLDVVYNKDNRIMAIYTSYE
jgi:hypothetical protein